MSKNDTDSWADLLSFPKMSLHIPARGGRRWSLATLINKQVAQFSSLSETHDTPVHKYPNPSKKTDYLTFLSNRVASKLEEGDYRGAVRLVSSEDTIAPHNATTLEALHLHDAITILRHSFSIPKLLHTLCTSPAFSSPILNSWDHLMKSIVCRITNIYFDQSDTWLQATLPVKVGGLGFQSASTLAPSAFLASAEGASELMRQLLPASLSTVSYLEKDKAWSAWKQAAPEGMSAPPNPTRQAAWDRPIVHHIFDTILDRCADETSQSRLLGAATSESGAWLNAPPVSSLGLRMSNKTVRIAMGLRIGAPLCLPHNCKCGEHVEATVIMA